MLHNRLSILAAFGAAALVSAPVLAGPFGLEHVIENPTPGALEDFGYSVDISGSRAIIGQRREREGPLGVVIPGATYIVEAATGAVTTVLRNPNQTINESEFFGASVALDGNFAAVGSLGFDGVTQNQGAAYVFDATTGNLISTLSNPDATGNPSDRFGDAIDISGTKVVVGNSGEDEGNGLTGTGAAYIFDALSGDLLHNLASPNINDSGFFGWDVAIDDELIAVSAFQEDRRTQGGAVHLFDAGTGEFFSTIENPFPGDSEGFGWSLAVNNGKVLVGTRDDTPGATMSEGGAYLFDAATGDLIHSFFSPTPERFGYFGSSVSLSDDYVAVGSVTADFGNVEGTGAAFLFDVVTGDLVQSVANPFPARGDGFTSDRTGIAIDGSNLVVGAFGDDTTGDRSGRAYIYRAGLDNPDPDPDPNTVPTPGAAMIFGLGLLGLAAMRRRSHSPM